MKRCAIVVLYDKEGVIDEYIFALLVEIKTVANRVIVVINGDIQDHFMARLQSVTDEVIGRENKGLDGTAYKEILLNYLEAGELHEYDELILCNDTFFGPFQPLVNIFEEMKHKQGDFWGLLLVNGWWGPFCASFFLVFRKTILRSNCLEDFFAQMGVIHNYPTACFNFEYALSDYLLQRNYSYVTYAIQETGIIYDQPTESILGTKLDILKKRCFSSKYYKEEELLNILRYIYSKTNYSIEMILDSINRIYRCGILMEQVKEKKYEEYKKSSNIQAKVVASQEQIRKFMESYEQVYLYGAGFYTSIFLYKYEQYRTQIAGVVVSDGQRKERRCEGYEVLEYSELLEQGIESTTAIFVAVRDAEQLGIKELLGEKEKVFYLFG